MLFNVINYSNQVICQVEANDAVEAWSEAGKKYERILDVRVVEVTTYTPFFHPRFRQVGPTETVPPEVWEIWNKALETVRRKYPIDDPILVAEAKRAELSQEQMQMLIAQDEYLEEKNKLQEKWREEYRKEEPEEKEEEEEED